MKPLVLWHASRADIPRPTLAGRIPGSDTHANSGLGLFCATAPDDYIAGFGPYVFEIELVSSARVKRLTIGEFARLSRSAGETWEETSGTWASSGPRTTSAWPSRKMTVTSCPNRR